MSIESERGSPFSTFSISPRKKSTDWNSMSNSSGLRASGTTSMVFSRMMKKRSSIRCATVMREGNSIMAEEPLMVCMMRKISFTLSCEKVSACSAASRMPSSCSRRVFVSYKYISRMLSLPLPIKTPPFFVFWFCMREGQKGKIPPHWLHQHGYRQDRTKN